MSSATFRPYKRRVYHVRQATRDELIVGREFKRFSRVGILRNVWLETLSVCGRYARITYRPHGPTYDCATSELLVWKERNHDLADE